MLFSEVFFVNIRHVWKHWSLLSGVFPFNKYPDLLTWSIIIDFSLIPNVRSYMFTVFIWYLFFSPKNSVGDIDVSLNWFGTINTSLSFIPIL